MFNLAIASWRCVKGRLRKRGEAWQLFSSPPRETPPHLPCTSTQSLNTLLHCSQRSSLLNYQPASSYLRDPSLSSSPQPAIITSILTLSALQADFAPDTLQRFRRLVKRVSNKIMMEAWSRMLQCSNHGKASVGRLWISIGPQVNSSWDIACFLNAHTTNILGHFKMKNVVNHLRWVEVFVL